MLPSASSEVCAGTSAGVVVVRAARPAADRLLALADRYRWWLYGVTLLFYAAAFNGQWRVQPDAALYLSIGRNLAEGHGYTYLGQTNRLALPGWPLMIAAVFKVFGTGSLVPVHAVLLLVAAGTLAATYRLVRLRAGRPTAVVVTFGTGLTKSFFVYALELWTDLPFAMAAMAVLAGYEGVFGGPPERRSRWYDWALLVGGLGTALAVRPTGWPLLLAVVLSLAFDAARGRLRWGTLVAVAAVGVTVAAACVALDPRRGGGEAFGGTYEQYLLHRLAGGGTAFDRPFAAKVYGLFTRAASDVLFQVRFGDAANSVLSGVVLLLGFGLFRARVPWGLWFTLLLTTVLLLVQETLDRYFLPVLPLLVYAWWSSLAWADRRAAGTRWRWATDGLVLVVLGFGFGANVSKLGGLVGQQRARPASAARREVHRTAPGRREPAGQTGTPALRPEPAGRPGAVLGSPPRNQLPSLARPCPCQRSLHAGLFFDHCGLPPAWRRSAWRWPSACWLPFARAASEMRTEARRTGRKDARGRTCCIPRRTTRTW